MKFNYFYCENCKKIIDEELVNDSKDKHGGHFIIGQFFKIRKTRQKKSQALVARCLVDKAREKLNIERYEKREELEKKRKRRAQEQFSKQILPGDLILNLRQCEL